MQFGILQIHVYNGCMVVILHVVNRKVFTLSRRKSERVTDKERRNLAEKIRQENLQKEKEMLEQLRKEKEDNSAELASVSPPEKTKVGGRGHKRGAAGSKAKGSPATAAGTPESQVAGKTGRSKKETAVCVIMSIFHSLRY